MPVIPVGSPETDSATVPALPTRVVVAVIVPVPAWMTERLAGLAEIVKSAGAGTETVTDTVAV